MSAIISRSESSTGSDTASCGITRFSIVRIVLGLLAVCIPVAVVLILSKQIPAREMRAFWPPLLAALLGLGGYIIYVRRVEKRAATEFAKSGSGREFGAGVGLGALLFVTTLGVLFASGSYQMTGVGSWLAMAKSGTEMLFVALIEEILFRGVIFRLSERSLGTWIALAIAAVTFALAHLPNAHITALAVANTAVAGLLFSAAYLISRRLWLPFGMHFAWNFVSDGVFSTPTSGNPGHGLLEGRLAGPEWMTGGSYGLEASTITLIVLALLTGLLLRRAYLAGHFMPYPCKEKVDL